MDEHNDISDQRVRTFVVTIIDDVVRRNLARISAKTLGRSVAPETSILGDLAGLEERMETILRSMPRDVRP